MEILVKVLYIIGLYGAFLANGYYEERLYKGKFNINGKLVGFGYPSLPLLVNSLFNIIISYLVLATKKQPKESIFKTKDKVMMGFYNLIIKLSGDYSLQYLDYITKILGKSCKAVSIIIVFFLYKIPLVGDIVRMLIGQDSKSEKIETHNGFWDFVKVGLTTLSIVLFNVGEKKEETVRGEPNENFNIFLFGIFLLSICLFFDGVLALKEKLINHEVHYKMKTSDYDASRLSWDYMYIFNIYAIVPAAFALGYSYVFSNFGEVAIEYLKDPECLKAIFLYSFTLTIGQIFIFQILEKWGPLNLSILTGVRKILSIGLSIVLFNKELSTVKAISLACGICVIVLEVIEKVFHTGSHPHKHKTSDGEKINKTS